MMRKSPIDLVINLGTIDEALGPVMSVSVVIPDERALIA